MLKTSNFIFGLLRQWKPKPSRLIIVLLCLQILSPPILRAQEKQEEINLPSLELIAFLGSFEDDDMGWVDPLELMMMDDADLQESQNEEVSDEK